MAAFMRKKIPTFSPTNISGCQVWFDAADPSTIVAPTGPVLSWTSKGAASMTATPSGTAPTYTKYNGFPGIAFNGSSTKMTTPTTYSFGTTGSTWIAVSVNFSPVSATLPPDASVVVAAAGAPERAIRYDSTVSATSYSIHSGTLRQDTGNNTNGIRGFIDTAAAFNAYTNGTNTFSSSTAVTFQASSNQGLIMGQWNIGWLNGFIFEVVIYNRDLTITEYQQVEAYLAQKWGYKDLLPIGHPGTTSIIVPQVSKIVSRPVLYYKNYQLTQIPGCLLWLDAADPAATGSVGTAITSWKDKSGNNNHFTVTSGTATVTLDGVYTVVGIPTGTLLTSTNTIATTSNTTVFAVFKSTNTAYMMFLAFSGLLSGDLSIRCSSYVVPPGGSTNSNDLFNGVTMYVDGNINTSANMSTYRIISGTMSTSGTTSVTISSTAWSSGRMFIGNVAEIVMYSGPLTTAQRQNVESYLANKWGMVSRLPAAHPNATVPAGLPFSVPSVMNLIFALSKFMSTVYNLSTYSLVNIANNVTASSATPTYIWVASVPSGAKGKNGILAIAFNMYSATAFTANQYFDYGVYVDGVSQFMGDSATMRYVQTSNGNYAIAYGGISLGTNGIMGGLPLFVPLVLGPSASQIQIGLVNSSGTMTSTTSTAPGYSSNILTSSGTGATLVPQNTFTTLGSNVYTVPANTSAGTPVGVYIYLWGSGGGTKDSRGSGAGGGYVSGFYSCSPGTNLIYVVGSIGGQTTATGGGGYNSGSSGDGGGFSGIFLSNAGGIVQSNAVAIAGGGGGGGWSGYSYGGYGGYPNGGATYNSAGTVSTYIGGSQTAGGISLNPDLGGHASEDGGALRGGGPSYSGQGGGGWFGGAGNGQGGGGTGGSSYIGNVNGATGGIGFTTGAVTSNGIGLTLSAQSSNQTYPGGNTSPYYVSGKGMANVASGGNGLVVIVPAVGTSATQIGVSATLFSA